MTDKAAYLPRESNKLCVVSLVGSEFQKDGQAGGVRGEWVAKAIDRGAICE